MDDIDANRGSTRFPHFLFLLLSVRATVQMKSYWIVNEIVCPLKDYLLLLLLLLLAVVSVEMLVVKKVTLVERDFDRFQSMMNLRFSQLITSFEFLE